MERIKEILRHIQSLPDNAFADLISDPERMQTIKNQFHSFIEVNNVKTQDGRKLRKTEVEDLFNVSVKFGEKQRFIIEEDRNDGRNVLNLFLSYYISRLEVTPPRNRGELKQSVFCLGHGNKTISQDEEGKTKTQYDTGNIDYIVTLLNEHGISHNIVTSDNAEQKPKDEAQKRAERMRKHTTGQLPVKVPSAGSGSDAQKQESKKEAEEDAKDKYHVFVPLTLDDILETPPLDFLTDNLIVRNTVNVFFAPAKTGKTYLCLSYAISMVMGIPFVGMENHLKRNVGYLNLDMFRGGFNDRVKQVIKGFEPNATPEYISNILSRLKLIDREAIRTVGGHIPNFFKKEHLDDLQNFIIENDIEFLFIDTFSRVRGGSAENDNDEMAITLQNMEEFFTPLECGCMLIHHTGKDGKLRGASAIIDNAEFVFGLRKVNGSNKHLQLFSDTPRYTDTFELDVYPVFEQSTNEDTGAKRADSYFLTAVNPETDSNTYAQAVYAYLDSVGNAYTSKKKIAYHAEGNYDMLRKEIDELYALGKLERVKSGSGFNYRRKTEGI